MNQNNPRLKTKEHKDKLEEDEQERSLVISCSLGIKQSIINKKRISSRDCSEWPFAEPNNMQKPNLAKRKSLLSISDDKDAICTFASRKSNPGTGTARTYMGSSINKIFWKDNN